MSRILGFTVFCLVVTAARPVQAQSDERARLHFESGRAYFEEAQYERALQEFQQAYQLSNRHMMLWNIGTTQERLGQYAAAADSYERYLQNVPEAEDPDVLRRRITNLRERAGRQDDGTEPPPQTTATATTEPGPAPSGGGGDGLVIGGAVALGIGGAALIAFGAFGGLALSEQSAVEDGCFATRTCTPDMVSAMDGYALAADVLWPIGTAAAAVGLVLIILGATSSSADTAALRMTPVASPTGGGFSLEGSF